MSDEKTAVESECYREWNEWYVQEVSLRLKETLNSGGCATYVVFVRPVMTAARK